MLAERLSTSGQGREVSTETREHPLQAAADWHRHTEPDQWKKYSPEPTYLPRRFETSEGEGGVGTQITTPLQIDLQGSAWIHKVALKQMRNDPLR